MENFTEKVADYVKKIDAAQELKKSKIQLEKQLEDMYQTQNNNNEKITLKFDGRQYTVGYEKGGMNSVNKNYVAEYLTAKLCQEKVRPTPANITNIVNEMFSVESLGYRKNKFKIAPKKS